MAISVVVPVGEKTANALVKRLKPRVESLRVGIPTDPEAAYGPMVTAAHRQKVIDYIDMGVKEGAELVVDGRGFRMQGYNGFYLGGSLFDRVTPNMKTYQDEIFGPVLQVARARDFDDAAWSGSMSQFPCCWPVIPLGAGNARPSVTQTSTAPRASASGQRSRR